MNGWAEVGMYYAAGGVALLVVAVVWIVAWRRDRARLLLRVPQEQSALSKECTNCGRRLKAGATNCDRCGADGIVIVV